MAYVFIEKPDCESMFLVGSHISSFFAQHHPTARYSGFITDRELALKSLISETFPFFRRTKHLHCAIHMKENLKARLGQKTGEETFCRLFGNDRNRGLLDIVTEKTLFYLQFNSIVMEMIPGKPREWLRKQEEQLNDGGSLEVRLKILAVSIFGNETEFVLRESRMAFGDGRRLSLNKKRSLAKEYGLEAVISTVEGPESFPPWMNDGRLGLSKKRFQEWVESIKITKSTFSPTRFFCDDTDFSGKSELPFVAFDGQSIQCSCRSGRWLICPHLAAFYLFADQKRQVVSILRMRLELELPSERNCRLRTENEGSKLYSKRRGSPLTAQNYVRPHERIRIPSRLVALRRYLKTHGLEPSDVQRSPETPDIRSLVPPHRQLSHEYRVTGRNAPSEDASGGDFSQSSQAGSGITPVVSSLVASSPSHSSQAIGSASQPVVSSLGPPHPQLPHGYRVVSQTMSPGPQVVLPSATQTTRTASSASQPVVSLLGPPHPQLPHKYRVVSQTMSLPGTELLARKCLQWPNFPSPRRTRRRCPALTA